VPRARGGDRRRRTGRGEGAPAASRQAAGRAAPRAFETADRADPSVAVARGTRAATRNRRSGTSPT
jgi:hypothetical protein